MKIKGIELKNYRLYKYINSITFPNGNDRNLFLITGENGFGKTTFLHSLIWCLYGRLMVDVDDTFRKEISNSGGYNDFLRNNLNEASRQKLFSEISESKIVNIKKTGYKIDSEHLKELSQYYVSLEFSDVLIPSIPCESLKITRYYDIIVDKEVVEILIDGVPNELSNEIGYDIFINDFILNKDIARFFFFDSEKIVSLAESNTLEEKRKLSSAYNEVLGVKKYEDLKKNLENLRLRFRKKSDDLESRNKLNNLIYKQNELEKLIQENELQNTLYSEELSNLKIENEKLQIQLLREGNNVTIDELKRQEAVLQKTKEKDDDYKQKLKLFLEFAPFAVSGKLLQDTKKQLERDFQILESEYNLRTKNELLLNISIELKQVFDNTNLSTGDKRYLINSFDNIISKYQKNVSDSIPLLSVNQEEIDEFLSVYSNLTTTYRVEFEYLADDYRKNKQILDRTARNISNMHSKESDALIKKIRKEKNKIEQEIADLETKVLKLHEEKGGISTDLAVVNRLISELSKKVSLDDGDVQKDKVAENIISELNVFLVSLKNEKKQSLESRIKSTMNSLMHKSDFIGQVDVKIEDDMIDINLISSEGNLINKEILSKGEQQLYATSLLKALVEESGIQFPVFIDSPLQKFDKSHAKKIISEFYPTVSKQVILFPLLHKELTETELEIMKPIVNATYKLKNENTYSYIQQVDINDLMKD